MTELDEASQADIQPSSAFVQSTATHLVTLDEELARLRGLLGKWARAKYRGPQATTILANEMRVQCEELVASAHDKLSQVNVSSSV